MSQHASSVAHLHPRPPEPRPALHLVRTVSPRAPYVGLPTLFDLDAYSTVDTEAEQVRDGFLLAYRGHTLDSYRTDLRLWFRWCFERGRPVLEAKRVDIELFVQAMEDCNLKPSTIQRRLVTICGYYRYAEEEDIIVKSPGRYVRRPRVPNESTSAYLDRIEAVRFLNTAEEISVRHAALACLLTLNGLRVSEACNASISDLNLSVKGHHTLTITRKGGKEAEVPLSARAFRNVIQAVDHRPDGPLLLDSLGHRMSRDAAARAVRLITKRAGIGKKIGPHALRHTFVSLGLDFGIPLRDMQTAAGHADPSTTTRYDRRDRDLDKHASYIVAAVIGS